MSYKIKLRREARVDIQETQSWYENQKPGLGTSFYESLKTRIDFLSANPYYYAVKYGIIRSAFLKGYPYSLHYIIEEEEKQVIVLAVLHTSRNPKVWQERQ